MQNRKKFTASFRSIFNKDANPWKKELFARWFTQLDLSKGQLFSSKTEEEETAKKMEQNLYHHFFPETGNTKVVRWPIWITTTAATVAVIISILWFTNGYKKDQKLVFKETFTLPGERKLITLSDGSVVSINSESSIRYPEVFTGATREIYLKGEAFFEVSRDKKHPFIIQTEQLKVKVLGTSFGVKAYHQDEEVEVAVATGKVGVISNRKSNNKAWLLTPGQQMSYNKSTGNFSKQLVRTTDIKNWQQNILVFNFETLENITQKLERVYGVTFIFKDKSLLKKRFQLKVKNEVLSNIMKLLSISGEGFRYKITGKQVTIG